VRIADSAQARAMVSAPSPVWYQVPASWKRMSADGAGSQSESAIFEVTDGVNSKGRLLMGLRNCLGSREYSHRLKHPVEGR